MTNMSGSPDTSENPVLESSIAAHKTPDRIIRIDAEHTGIRIVLPLLVFVGLAGGYFITAAIISALNADSLSFLPLVMALVGAILATTVGDKLLKQLWPSGRSLVLHSDSLELIDKRKGSPQTTLIRFEQRINAIAWRFKVSRGSARVPKGWFMLGLKLLQDEAEITVYTFIPEKEAAKLPNFNEFVALAGRADLESDKLSMREKGRQRRLLNAEQERWQDGAEISREDFPVVITALHPYVTDWQPSDQP